MNSTGLDDKIALLSVGLSGHIRASIGAFMATRERRIDHRR